MKRVTNLGLWWEWKNSIWMIFLVTPFTLPISYFYPGICMYQKKWIYVGFIYYVLLNGGSYTVWVLDSPIEDVTVIPVIFMVFIYINGVVRLSMVRKDYLLYVSEYVDHDEKQRLVEKENKRKKMRDMNRQARQNSNILSRTDMYKRQSANSKFVIPENEKNKSAQVLNINTSSVNELKRLPKMNRFLAEKIIHTRDHIQSFSSFHELIKETEIQKHVLEEASDYIAFTDEEIDTLKMQLKTKQLRIKRQKKELRGRHIDY